MAIVKIQELRELSDEELTSAIAQTKRDLFDLRFKKATRQLETGFHQFKHSRRKLAQLMTIERERQLAAIASADQTAATAQTDTATAQTDAAIAQTEEEA
ncbi:50S ribosomal protein L29 [cf. Phormidesmis sp. LEGE 11477]|uniref:50S ribosomal protein L29 n=1 Tax=cf. Phormidesmis sp. LEGE 11477 TaxID=1828680 RepID=UPI001882490D|nr:50S ribosomal protein L29 [cf. Phormidesmis sp. LEGE 11477]MBE9061487.1 50S ribosomal protein L29 [cf. Phormidesmis sp. LEGE 11477]